MNLTIAKEFVRTGRIVELSPLGGGIINDTYLVKTDASSSNKFILQKINERVFTQPRALIDNLRQITASIVIPVSGESEGQTDTFQIPGLIAARSGKDYFIDENFQLWRAMVYVDNTQTFETIQHIDQAREVGYALGLFHALLSQLEPSSLIETIPNFHNTGHYLDLYDHIECEDGSSVVSEQEKYCEQFIADHRHWVPCIVSYASRLTIRVVHGDPKLNNILFDRQSGKAVSIIDLDTVSAGLIQHDLGDCLRSCCNVHGENTRDLRTIEFDIHLCEAILTAYVEKAHVFLTEMDYRYLYEYIQILPFELGLRFFTDYKTGNAYFKIAEPHDNLHRAITQFTLLESIESQASSIRDLIRKIAP